MRYVCSCREFKTNNRATARLHGKLKGHWVRDRDGVSGSVIQPRYLTPWKGAPSE